ncbi:MAG TPA: vanadium-dependent haloperoxidase, partial [Acidobacteriota bacterium]
AETIVELNINATRKEQAFRIRVAAATYQKNLPQPPHPVNGDEQRYQKKIGNYSKGLPHNERGEVVTGAYEAFVEAISSNQMDKIPLGGTAKQANPEGAFAFNLEGADSHHLGIAAPPAFASAEEAAEMAEMYWRALTRDVPFLNYETDPLIQAAANNLSSFSGYQGPKAGGIITPAVLFRGNFPGNLNGPFISQFLLKNIPYGSKIIVQKNRTTTPDDDHMISYPEWLTIQNGNPPSTDNSFDKTYRYIRNGRDLTEYVHRDYSYQAFLNAALYLIGLRAPVDSGNPYLGSATTGPFVTFGAPYILDMVARVTNAALKAAWYQKWLLHRRLRPEEFGGRVQNHLAGAAKYPIHKDLLTPPGSAVLDAIHNKYGSYLLPMAYPEGCPLHPSYPAGHAVIAGACATVLKAVFEESFVLPGSVVASVDGLKLQPFNGETLTLGGEVNKLASNITFARDTAGVHWRSDGVQGILLGEAVAISILRDLKRTFVEFFNGFSLTKFNGETITI